MKLRFSIVLIGISLCLSLTDAEVTEAVELNDVSGETRLKNADGVSLEGSSSSQSELKRNLGRRGGMGSSGLRAPMAYAPAEGQFPVGGLTQLRRPDSMRMPSKESAPEVFSEAQAPIVIPITFPQTAAAPSRVSSNHS